MHIFGQYGIFTDFPESLIKKKKTLLTKRVRFPPQMLGADTVCSLHDFVAFLGEKFACGKLFLAAVFKGP